MTQAELVPHEVFEASMFDRRLEASRKWVYGSRLWTDITGVCLHQTACHMGEHLQRYDAIGAHFAITREGKALRMHDLTDKVVSANGFNNRCISIEFDGLYEGVDGDPRTLWRDRSAKVPPVAMKVTPYAMEAGRQLVRWIHEEIRRHGGSCTKLVAHRQSSGDRPNDPGSAIWGEVALPMHAELGMDDGGVGFAIPDGAGGKPIPEVWDPRCRGIRY